MLVEEWTYPRPIVKSNALEARLKNFKYVIYAPPYNETAGGSIALHKLCHNLNEIGCSAFLLPLTKSRHAIARRAFHYLAHHFPVFRTVTGKGFKTNASLNTRLLPFGFDLRPDRTITVYPEIIAGNPLGAKHVVRWFLHKPGSRTGVAEFGSNEFHIDFNHFLKNYVPKSDNHVSASSLFVIHIPFDTYNLDGALPSFERQGIAYCVRKGKVDKSVDLTDAICIDGMSHLQASAVLKKVKYFYSFDLYTAYSRFAALCGAISFVIPPPGVTKEDWYPEGADRYGIGFGTDEESWAISTQHLVLPSLKERERGSLDDVRRFVEEVEDFFSATIKAQRS